jgi:hypothetical protein
MDLQQSSPLSIPNSPHNKSVEVVARQVGGPALTQSCYFAREEEEGGLL